MQQAGQKSGWGGVGQGAGHDTGHSAGHERVQAETLATLSCEGESLAEVAHDARNMVTALGLYCDLLEEPGVLTPPFIHYGSELRLVAAASRRLVEKVVALDSRDNPASLADGTRGAAWPPTSVGLGGALLPNRSRQARRWDLMPALPIDNLAAELLANKNLLAALAGPAVALTVDAVGCALAVKLTGEDLTRVLVNLVKNAAEAMPAGGRVQLNLRERPAAAGTPKLLLLAVDDTGPGIPGESLEAIFKAGFSTQPASMSSTGWPAAHRGLGLSITRSIVEAGGGSIAAQNRSPVGARFQIELPVRMR
jgi:signal transduction histidine kinase